MDWQERSRRLIGDDSIVALGHAHVIVFGLGGVGSFAAEALARSGVGKLSLVDYDAVADSNRNRQLPALSGTVGRLKVDVVETRLKDINPELDIRTYPHKATRENIDSFFNGLGETPGFIADAIDDLPAKVSLIVAALRMGAPIISSMGAAYRLDPTKLEIGDISKTHTCPLARRLRRALRDEGVTEGLPVVWSRERPIAGLANGVGANVSSAGGDMAEGVDDEAGDEANGVGTGIAAGRAGPASMVFVPAAAGILMASYIIRTLIN